MGSTGCLSSEAVDVIVIGSGVAGLAAAIEAANTGAKVQILEARDNIGGASIISGGGMCIVDSPRQQENGISDNIDLAFSDWTSMGGPTVDQPWARKYIENSRSDVYEWAENLGVQWTDLKQPEGNRVPRWHQPADWGRGVVEALLKRTQSLAVDIRVKSTVKRLIQKGGAICGVEVCSDDNNSHVVDCSRVIVCTGGFSGDLSKVLENAPQLRNIPRLLSGGASVARGLGHDILKDVSADFCSLDHIWVYPVGTPDPTDPSGKRGLGVRGLTGDIWLNIEGHRFHNEHLKGGRSGAQALLAQPSQTAWMVLCASEIEHLELINNPEYFPPEQNGKIQPKMSSFWSESSHARRVSNVVDLATATGLPVDSVLASVHAFNADVAAGLEKDSSYGRPLNGAFTLDSDLAAIQLFPMAQKTFGGVRTDLNCRVISQSGAPVPGLYAAGEVAGMAGGCINGRAAIEGTMYGPCLYSGRVAGITALSDLFKK